MDSQIEIAIRHEISVNRLAASIVRSRIDPAFVDISELVRRLLDDYDQAMPSRDLEALRKRTRKALIKALDDMWAASTSDLKDFSEYEAEYHSSTIAALVGAQALPVSAAALAKKYDQPLLLASGDSKTIGLWPEYVAGNKSAVLDLVDAEIRSGRASGMTLGQMITRLVGTKKKGYTDGLIVSKARKWAENLVRTGTSHYANAARDAVADGLKKHIEGKVFSNVLDNRTTRQCLHHGQQAHQGKIYKLNDPAAPRIPLHFNCRSIWLFKLYGVDPFAGKRASLGGKKGKDAEDEYAMREQALRDKRELRAQQRADGKDTPTTPSKVRYAGKKDATMFDPKQIDANVSPQKFMESQPDWFLESALGKTRAKLFRKGGLPIEKFTDVMGNPLTLKQMRVLDEYDAYFRKAGL